MNNDACTAVEIMVTATSVLFSFSDGLDMVEIEFSTYEHAISWLDDLTEQLTQMKVDEVFG